MIISPKQARAARAYADLTLQKVQDDTDIKKNSISRFESKGGSLTDNNAAKLKKYYEEFHKIDFIKHNGICQKPKSSTTQLDGKDGFITFMKDVAETVERPNTKSDVCVSGVDERLFEKWQGDYATTYLKRMETVSKRIGFKSRIIITEGDYYCTALKYAEYRHLDDNSVVSAASYIYGDKLALIIFEEHNVTVTIIESEALANGQRKLFNIMWDSLEQ